MIPVSREHQLVRKAAKARRALNTAVRRLRDSDLDAMNDSWREDFLKTLDDVAMRIDVVRLALTGTLTGDLEQFVYDAARAAEKRQRNDG